MVFCDLPQPFATFPNHPQPSANLRYPRRPSATLGDHPLPSATIRYSPRPDLRDSIYWPLGSTAPEPIQKCAEPTELHQDGFPSESYDHTELDLPGEYSDGDIHWHSLNVIPIWSRTPADALVADRSRFPMRHSQLISFILTLRFHYRFRLQTAPSDCVFKLHPPAAPHDLTVRSRHSSGHWHRLPDKNHWTHTRPFQPLLGLQSVVGGPELAGDRRDRLRVLPRLLCAADPGREAADPLWKCRRDRPATAVAHLAAVETGYTGPREHLEDLVLYHSRCSLRRHPSGSRRVRIHLRQTPERPANRVVASLLPASRTTCQPSYWSPAALSTTLVNSLAHLKLVLDFISIVFE